MPAGLWGGRQAKFDVKAGKIDVVLYFPAYCDRSSDKNYVKWHLQYLNLFAVKSAVMQNIAFFLPFTQGQSHDHVLTRARPGVWATFARPGGHICAPPPG